MSEINPGRTGRRGIYGFEPSPRPWVGRVDDRDVLAAPDDDAMATLLARLLPPGAAWRTPDAASFDASSTMGRTLRGFAAQLGETFRRLFATGQESTASTLIDSLEDWEAEYGLPDPCFGFDQTRAQRIRALLARVRSKGTITPGDFIRLAASIGYVVTITEPRAFGCGMSPCGGSHGCGDAVHYFWRVHVSGRSVDWFRAGVGRTGVTPLGDVSQATDLECLFRALAPAWTRVIFDYSDLN